MNYSLINTYFKQAVLGITVSLLNVFILKSQPLTSFQQQAAENNPGLTAAYLEFQAAIERTTQAGGLPDPTLSMGYFISPVETRVGPQQVRLSLTQMFPWFGTLKLQENRAALLAEAAYAEFQDEKIALYYQVASAYYMLWETDELIRIRQQNVDLLNSYKNIATKKFENAGGTMVDVLKTDLLLQDLTASVEILHHRKVSMMTTFNRLLNRSDSIGLAPEVNPESDVTAAILPYDSLIARHPRLKAQQLKTRAGEQTEMLASRKTKPRLGVGVDYIFIGTRDIEGMTLPDNGKNAFMPMVTLSLPVFGKQYAAATKEAQFSHQANEMRSENIRNDLAVSFADTRYEIRQDVSLISLYNQQIDITRRALDLQFSAYSNDRETFQEVIDLQQKLLTYQIARIKTQTDLMTALARVDYLQTNYTEQ